MDTNPKNADNQSAKPASNRSNNQNQSDNRPAERPQPAQGFGVRAASAAVPTAPVPAANAATSTTPSAAKSQNSDGQKMSTNNNGRPGQGQGQGQNRGGRPGRGSNFTPRGTRHRGQNRRSSAPNPNAIPVNKSSFNGNGGEQRTQVKQRQTDTAVQGAPTAERKANQVTREPKLRIIFLGGLGEIGKNMMALELGNDIIIIDMGFGFPDNNQPGVDYIIPDTTYLEKNKHKVRAIIVTHGHMDHIGGAGYIIPKFPVPIYGSRLSLAFVEKQISEFRIGKPDFRVMDPDKHERVQIAGFNIELVRVTHTISDSTAVVVRTEVGTIINTGDWRLDPTPLDNRFMDMKRFEEIGKEGVLALLSDSTSCDRPGHGHSEQIVAPTIEDLFGRAQGRILISSFSSSITRVQLIIDAAAKAKRKLALVGRSTLANVELCVKLGYIKIPAGLLMRVQDIVRQPDDKVIILSTGSQGEENSALVRMSTGDHQNVKIKPGDTIILSSSVIPGNEKSVMMLIDNLMREGAAVYARSTEGIKHHGPVHVGGHAFREDIGDLIELIKPKYYVPIHGEFHHLVYSAEVAVERDVKPENIFVVDNGDVVELTPTTGRKADRVPSGIVMVDGSGVGDVEQVVLNDRLSMSSDGIFVVVATVDRKSGKLVSSPDIISRGFIYMKDNEELIGRVRAEIRKSFERRNTKEPNDWSKFKLSLRDDISDLLYKKTKRNPMIIPVINEI